MFVDETVRDASPSLINSIMSSSHDTYWSKRKKEELGEGTARIR
jgi:hypothetical protein